MRQKQRRRIFDISRTFLFSTLNVCSALLEYSFVREGTHTALIQSGFWNIVQHQRDIIRRSETAATVNRSSVAARLTAHIHLL